MTGAESGRLGRPGAAPAGDPPEDQIRTVPLAEIMEAAGCSKASASDYRRGKRTPHVSTWAALASASEGCNT
jgi:hypothetical protein